MPADLVVWHEPVRITHAEAAEKARDLQSRRPSAAIAHPAVAAFAAELAREFPDLSRAGDGKAQVLISLNGAPGMKVIPVIRYLAAKHRLVCYDVRQEAVVNPPLLRRVESGELTAAGDLPIEDPSPEHIERAIRELDDDFWFVIFDYDDDHYLQAGFGAPAGAAPGGYVLEYRDGSAEEHFQADVADAEELITAVQEHVAGEAGWRARFTWRPVTR